MQQCTYWASTLYRDNEWSNQVAPPLKLMGMDHWSIKAMVPFINIQFPPGSKTVKVRTQTSNNQMNVDYSSKSFLKGSKAFVTFTQRKQKRWDMVNRYARFSQKGKQETYASQSVIWVNSNKSLIQNFNLSVAIATSQNEKFAQNWYALLSTTQNYF